MRVMGEGAGSDFGFAFLPLVSVGMLCVLFDVCVAKKVERRTYTWMIYIEIYLHHHIAKRTRIRTNETGDMF